LTENENLKKNEIILAEKIKMGEMKENLKRKNHKKNRKNGKIKK